MRKFLKHARLFFIAALLLCCFNFASCGTSCDYDESSDNNSSQEVQDDPEGCGQR